MFEPKVSQDRQADGAQEQDREARRGGKGQRQSSQDLVHGHEDIKVKEKDGIGEMTQLGEPGSFPSDLKQQEYIDKAQAEVKNRISPVGYLQPSRKDAYLQREADRGQA